jgi:hypothetical protein
MQIQEVHILDLFHKNNYIAIILNSLLHVTIYEDIMLWTAPLLLMSVHTGSDVHSVGNGVSLPLRNPYGA